MASLCMWHESACFSQITMHHFKYTSGRFPLIRILTLKFPQCSKRISIAKTIHKMHICILCISKYRHFCCYHCSYNRYYCLSLTTLLQLSVLPWTLSAEPLWNDENNTNWHQCKNVVTWKLRQIWKKHVHFLLQMIPPNNLIKYCTRVLNHPVYKSHVSLHNQNHNAKLNFFALIYIKLKALSSQNKHTYWRIRLCNWWELWRNIPSKLFTASTPL
jgi:hypothetical protein